MAIAWPNIHMFSGAIFEGCIFSPCAQTQSRITVGHCIKTRDTTVDVVESKRSQHRAKMRLLLSITVLSAAFAFGQAQFDEIVENGCMIGDEWVEEKIKFECFSEGDIVLGARPIGMES